MPRMPKGQRERIEVYREEDLAIKASQYIGARISRHQQGHGKLFILGISGTNGTARRGRAKDVFSALGSFSETDHPIDWSRVRVFLLDERYGASKAEEPFHSNRELIRNSLLASLKKRDIGFNEAEHFLYPDTSLAWEECAADYQKRVLKLFEDAGVQGPTMVTTGLWNDGSLASVFPDWYRGNYERRSAVFAEDIRIICTEAPEGTLEVPKRVTVNLRVFLVSEFVLVFLADDCKDAWTKPAYVKKKSQSQIDDDPGKVVWEDGTEVALGDDIPSGDGNVNYDTDLPMGFMTNRRYVCVAQVHKDLKSHLNLIVLGAAGDLAKKKTFPSIFQLHLGRVMPTNVSIVAADNTNFHSDVNSAQEILDNRLSPFLKQASAQPNDLEDFSRKLQFVPISISKKDAPPDDHEKDMETFRKLDEMLKANTKSSGAQNDNRIFYLALPPFLFASAAHLIKVACSSANGFVRVIVEKPFGSNLATAKELGKDLAAHLKEPQIYRIDHYLAKTMVLNILTLRFANREFGRLFHADNVANVRITFKEDIDLEGRAGYFDSYGIIRDVMQNHLLQLLTLVLMEAPASLDAEDVRNEKVKVLKQIRAVKVEDCVVGQYQGYMDHDDVRAAYEKKGGVSKCATFAACVLWLDNERWSGVPLIMKAGKALETRSTIVRIQFKKAPENSLFGDQPQNELTIRIQPEEAIYYRMLAKTTGLTSGAQEVQRTKLDLDLRKGEVGRQPDAYEKLIYDVIQGESHNFVREDEVEEGWRIFDGLIRSLEGSEAPQPLSYEKFSRGPKPADDFILQRGFVRYSHTGVKSDGL